MGEKADAAIGFGMFIIIIALIVTVVILLFPGETTEDKEIREMQEKIDKKILDTANKIKISTEQDTKQKTDEIIKMIKKDFKPIDETKERTTVELIREVEHQNFIRSTLSDKEIEWLDLVEDTTIPKFNELMGDRLELCESVYSQESYMTLYFSLIVEKETLEEIYENYLKMKKIIKDGEYIEYGNIKELILESSEILDNWGDCITEKSGKYLKPFTEFDN